jgi:hypothetical protein
MDSADKATNKAMSAAYKYAAFQAFAIPTEGDNDADAHTPDVGRGANRQAKKPEEVSDIEAALFAAGLDEMWLVKQAEAADWNGATLSAIAANKDWLDWANDIISKNKKVG